MEITKDKGQPPIARHDGRQQEAAVPYTARHTFQTQIIIFYVPYLLTW